MNRRKSKHKEKLNIAMFGQKRIPSREGGVEIVVEELCTRMVAQGHNVTCYNRGGHHVSGSEYDSKRLKEYKGIKLKTVPTIEKKGLAAVSSSFFAALCCAFGQYDIVHIHAEGPAFFACQKNAQDIEALLCESSMKEVFRNVRIAEKIEDIL